MKIKEIRELSDSELEKKIRDKEHDYVNLRISKQSGKVESTQELNDLRKDIARLKSILKEKQLIKLK